MTHSPNDLIARREAVKHLVRDAINSVLASHMGVPPCVTTEQATNIATDAILTTLEASEDTSDERRADDGRRVSVGASGGPISGVLGYGRSAGIADVEASDADTVPTDAEQVVRDLLAAIPACDRTGSLAEACARAGGFLVDCALLTAAHPKPEPVETQP